MLVKMTHPSRLTLGKATFELRTGHNGNTPMAVTQPPFVVLIPLHIGIRPARFSSGAPTLACFSLSGLMHLAPRSSGSRHPHRLRTWQSTAWGYRQHDLPLQVFLSRMPLPRSGRSLPEWIFAEPHQRKGRVCALPLQVISICTTLVGEDATTLVEALSGTGW